RDPGDPVGLPDVREDLAANIFQLVQFVDGGAAISHSDASRLLKGCGVEKMERVTSIAHDEPVLVTCETPPLTRVTKRVLLLETHKVVDKPNIGLRRELDQAAVPIAQAIREVCRIDAIQLD